MLRSGLLLVRRSGLRALTIRAVTQRAKVNLGSFVYHFGSRAAFTAELIERWYAPLWAQLQATVDAALPPVERLRLLVLQLFEWVATNRVMLGHLFLDAAAREAAALAFLRSLQARHPALILQAIRDAQAAGQLRQADPLQLLMFTMSAIGVPIMFAHGLAAARLVPAPLSRELLALAVEPRHIEQRLGWVLDGLAPAAKGH